MTITDQTVTKKNVIKLVISKELGETIISIIQDISQISSIYIFGEDDEKWTNEWPKVSGFYTDTTHICETLKQDTRRCDHYSISIDFVKKTDGTNNRTLDTLVPSFMYTQILKEILLTIKFEQVHLD